MTTVADHHAAAIRAAARALAGAESNHARAVREAELPQAERAKIVARLADLDAKRAAVADRRGRGQTGPDDGGILALIGVDREALETLLVAADAAVAEATRPVEAAYQAVISAHQHLQHVEAQAEMDALVEHAKHLDGIMLATLQRLAPLTDQRGGRPPYGPTAELRTALRRVSMLRGEM
jgi:hypothetical protein